MRQVLVPTYHSLKDPILEGHLLKYLIKIGERGQCQFVLITYEQEQYKMSHADITSLKSTLFKKNIIWIPKRYLTDGVFMMAKKLWNFLTTASTAFRYAIFCQVDCILAFTSISGAMASILSMVLRKPLIIFCFEPHSLYMADFGIWTRESINFKLLNKLEHLQVRQASELLIPNEYSKRLVMGWGAKGNIHVVPFCIDDEDFRFDSDAREKIRKELSISNGEKVLLYLGKFGGIYYNEAEVISFFSSLYELDETYHFLIITPNSLEQVVVAFENLNMPKEAYNVLGRVELSLVPHYVSASDIGFVAIPSLPSQRYRSPIKTANYMLCGLPYVVNRGVSDDDALAETHNIGVVINTPLVADVANCHRNINQLLNEDKVRLRKRIRETGLKYKKLDNAVQLFSVLIAKYLNK